MKHASRGAVLRWLRRPVDPEPRLLLSRPPAEVLGERLRALGLSGVREVRTHTNLSVMLSLGRTGILRLHQGYAWAPDRVLRAIVRFLRRGTPRVLRQAMRREFLGFPVEQFAPPWTRERRREPPRPGDLELLHRLGRMHERLNRDHFDGKLSAIPFRLSGRMVTRLGELTLENRTGRVLEIAISRRHLRHGWAEVEHTVLHEMVHQWQAETGLAVDHGSTFRRKASEVGVAPSAFRPLAETRRRASGE